MMNGNLEGKTLRERPVHTWEDDIKMNLKELRFQVLTAARMKMTVFWDVAPCSLIEFDRCFPMEALSTSEKSVNFYETTWHNMPEDSHLQS
jgi:hypothetical protein